jgi:hypothetical protein
MVVHGISVKGNSKTFLHGSAWNEKEKHCCATFRSYSEEIVVQLKPLFVIN